MSALTDRITEVLREYQCIRCGGFHAHGRVQNCGGLTTVAGLAHVAERVEAELREQPRWIDGMDLLGRLQKAARELDALTITHQDMTTVGRLQAKRTGVMLAQSYLNEALYMTPWSEVSS